MRFLGLVMLLFAIATTEPAAAQALPNVLFPGSAYPSVARGTNVWCAIEPGSAGFQRNGAAAARITVPEVTYVNHSGTPALSYRLGGLVVLTFANSTSGTVAFIVTGGAPTSISRATFTNYVQTYNSTVRSLNVTFWIRFPSCTLPVRLFFRT